MNHGARARLAAIVAAGAATKEPHPRERENLYQQSGAGAGAPGGGCRKSSKEWTWIDQPPRAP
jgi:hypothetical protein